MTIDHAAIYLPKEVAALLRCSQATIYNLISSGQLGVISIGAGGRGYRVRGSDIHAFLEASKTGGPSPRAALKHIRTA